MDKEIILLALADSVNPCTLAVMAALLLVVLQKRGRRDAAVAGLLFVTTVYVTYFLYGLGLFTFLTTTDLFTILRSAAFFLVLALAIWELKAYLFYKPGFSSLEMPLFLRPHARRLIHSVEHPLFAIPVAFFCSIFLLPCSSGPYIAAISLMGDITPLFIYNTIFVLPMLAVTLLVTFGLDPEKVLEWRNRHVRLIHLISSLLLFAVAFYIAPPLFPSPTPQPFHLEPLLLVELPTCPHCINLKSALHELNIPYRVISPSEARDILRERNLRWDGSVPLLIGKNFVMLGYPSEQQEVNGMFPDEPAACVNAFRGTPVYEDNRYLYCVLPNGMILGNRNVLLLVREGSLK